MTLGKRSPNRRLALPPHRPVLGDGSGLAYALQSLEDGLRVQRESVGWPPGLLSGLLLHRRETDT